MGETPPDQLSPDEMRAALAVLSGADLARLKKVAIMYARSRRLDADDLLQAAIVRALEGSRHCPRAVTVVRFLAETIRSVASGELKSRERRREISPVPRDRGDGADEVDLVDPCPGPEHLLESQQEQDCIKNAILPLFDDDLTAQTIVEGDIIGMPAEELRTLADLDHAAYASKRRFIRRRIDRAFPKGWTR